MTSPSPNADLRPTVLLSSGFPDAVRDAMSRSWRVVNIEDPAAALEWLRGAESMPMAVVIGYVSQEWPLRDSSLSGGILEAPQMLDAIRQLDRDLPVIISTRQQHPTAIVELVKRGGFDYVVERFHRSGEALDGYIEELQMALTRAIRWRREVLENRELRAGLMDATLPVAVHARSEAMRRVIALAHKVAPTHATVLITGESGVGKEVVARLLHGLSPRAAQPYLAINCGALDEHLLNSELFGHVRGAFTGADRDRLGLLREAAEGTVLLDEIATIAPSMQVNLLRVLEDRRARAVGSQKDYEVRCRFIAAGNRDLEAMVRDGSFREDLYYRLHVFHIRVPPLRDRREDIPVLASYFLTQAVRDLGKAIAGFAPAAMAWLERQGWPGNVRQLRNVIERAVILCDTERIELVDLDDAPLVATGRVNPALNLPYNEAMRHFERDLLSRALDRSEGNISAASRLLEMKRTTLAYRLRQVGLDAAGG